MSSSDDSAASGPARRRSLGRGPGSASPRATGSSEAAYPEVPAAGAAPGVPAAAGAGESWESQQPGEARESGPVTEDGRASSEAFDAAADEETALPHSPAVDERADEQADEQALGEPESVVAGTGAEAPPAALAPVEPVDAAPAPEVPAPASGPNAPGAPGVDAPSEEPPAHAPSEPDVAPTPSDAPAPDAAPEVPPETESAAVDMPSGAAEAPAEHPGTSTEEAPPENGEEEPDDGRFKVVLDNFEGPFDLLLQLISKHKLDVTEVALSKVTDEFMVHIHAMGPEWDLDQATEFLVVAATLLDLKAARLLPTAEVEDETDLALLEARDLLFARLLQYRAYKQIAEIFADRLATEGRRFPRTVGLEPHHAELLPEVVLRIGPEGFAKLAVKAMQPKRKPEVYVEHIHAPLVSVREQAQLVVARLREWGETSFHALISDADDTLTVVARFLALLELYRERAVDLEQPEALGDLTVSWTGGAGTDLRVTDEFDKPPEQPEEQRA